MFFIAAPDVDEADDVVVVERSDWVRFAMLEL